MDVNKRDEASGFTPLHQVCSLLVEEFSDNPEMIDRYFSAVMAGKDRFDLTIPAKCLLSTQSDDGAEDSEEGGLSVSRFMSCVEYVIHHRHSQLLTRLADLRKNDVIEIVIRNEKGGSSILYQLEEEHDALLTKLSELDDSNSLSPPEESEALESKALEGELRLDIMERLRRNQAVLKPILDILTPLAILERSSHLHERYFSNELPVLTE